MLDENELKTRIWEKKQIRKQLKVKFINLCDTNSSLLHKLAFTPTFEVNDKNGHKAVIRRLVDYIYDYGDGKTWEFYVIVLNEMDNSGSTRIIIFDKYGNLYRQEFSKNTTEFAKV